MNSLRSRPQKGLSPEERQSADMAEFALLRNDLPKNKARCIECLKAAYSAAPGSFWGWAAWTFLGDLGVKVPEPAKDPLRGLGAFGDGVVDMVPARLAHGARPKAKGEAARMLAAEKAKFDPAALSPGDLAPGSEKRRAVLRARRRDALPVQLDRVARMDRFSQGPRRIRRRMAGIHRQDCGT